MANILSLSKLRKRFPVHFDGEAMTFTAEFPSAPLIFRQIPEGLFYYDTKRAGAMSFAQIFNTTISDEDNVPTVRDRKKLA